MPKTISMGNIVGWVFLLGTIMFTVYGQLITKWQVGKAGEFPSDKIEKAWFLLRFLTNPWIVSSLAAGFLAFLCWIGTVSKFDLSYIYPFTSLSFLLVLVLSAFFFGEKITFFKTLGILFIMIGLILGSQG